MFQQDSSTKDDLEQSRCEKERCEAVNGHLAVLKVHEMKMTSLHEAERVTLVWQVATARTGTRPIII